MKAMVVTGWFGGVALMGAAIAYNDTMWLFLSLMAASIVVHVTLSGVLLVIGKASDYWLRQPSRVRAGLDIEPEPWYVRVTARSHDIKLLRRVLG